MKKVIWIVLIIILIFTSCKSDNSISSEQNKLENKTNLKSNEHNSNDDVNIENCQEVLTDAENANEDFDEKEREKKDLDDKIKSLEMELDIGSNKYEEEVKHNDVFIEELKNWNLVTDQRATSLEVFKNNLSLFYSDELINTIIDDKIVEIENINNSDIQKYTIVISYENNILTISIDGHGLFDPGKKPYYGYTNADIVSISEDRKKVVYRLKFPVKSYDNLNDSYRIYLFDVNAEFINENG